MPDAVERVKREGQGGSKLERGLEPGRKLCVRDEGRDWSVAGPAGEYRGERRQCNDAKSLEGKRRFS